MSGWNEKSPKANDPLNELAGIIRSAKSTLDAGLQHAFYWSDSTASAGVPRLSAVTGTARAFDAGASALSSSDTGRLYYENSGQRLYVLTPNASSESGMQRVGSARALVYWASSATVTANRYILSQIGSDLGNGAGEYSVTFPIAYATTPQIRVTVAGTVDEFYDAVIDSSTTTGFTYDLTFITLGPDPNSGGVYWIAEGEAAL